MYPPVDPIIFQIGPIALRWYGVLMAIAVVMGCQIASREVVRRGQKSDDFWDLLIWVLIPGFLGARLYYVFVQSPPDRLGEYLSNPISILQVWNGGIHIFGGFLLGSIALYLYTRIRRLPTLIFLDAIVLALPLSQAIGRWGNFINQELYGPPTISPLGLRIDAQHRIPPYDDLNAYPESTRFHPLFLYESVWNLIGFGLLFWISRRFASQLRDGDITLLYLIWYPLGRFFIELLRTDSWFFPGTPFNVVHILCAIAILGSALALYGRHRPLSSTQQGN
ncbi:MAG: prolipoprotein diacylglyceryl transferase [Drouetiella hepatica Uher 2000/2452]|jgi:phosphatidylglycerol:prolipoprotein diacylglycerol transferase|uniref:Phosphatidylglycerol--prolipoprotein diacylglyceryl transferase n=1 Tax=Drouetiella hepatica Uher 2000/2452 TaxID=904376 RepID=A0A951QE61_9CYAN|nr:prolipoprotein diacylglyceryl transferase [Drouetiella hepatica Uher 2000/2452]